MATVLEVKARDVKTGDDYDTFPGMGRWARVERVVRQKGGYIFLDLANVYGSPRLASRMGANMPSGMVVTIRRGQINLSRYGMKSQVETRNVGLLAEELRGLLK